MKSHLVIIECTGYIFGSCFCGEYVCNSKDSHQSEVRAEKDLRADISSDFENYKVRVHSVLKQQRTSGDNTVTRAEHEALV